MSDESEYYCGEGDLEDDDQADCDYGFEFCIDPFLRSVGNCFECKLYQEACELEEKEREEDPRKKGENKEPSK
jgi:hypothetical protein